MHRAEEVIGELQTACSIILVAHTRFFASVAVEGSSDNVSH